MQGVSEAWKAAQLLNIVPESFVEVSYRVTDPEADADASATDNGAARWANTEQIVDGVNDEFAKYITLELNSWALDGGSVYLGEQDTGFVSSVLSGDDGAFAAQPVVTINFTKVHPNTIPGVTVQFSTAFNEWATDFTITAYNGASVVKANVVTGNASPLLFVEMPVAGFDKIDIAVSHWSQPYHRARIEEVILGAVKVFEKIDIMGLDFNQSADLMSFELPKSEIVFQISNVNGEWNPDNPQGIFQYLLERQEISVRMGYKLGDSIEWIRAGTFFISEWETPQNGITASFTARDILEFMYNPFVVAAGDYTLYALANMAFTQSEIPATPAGEGRWKIADALKNITVTIPTDTDGNVDFDYTCAEVVQLCANAACCVMYQDRAGIFNIEPLGNALTDYTVSEFVSYANAEYEISKELKSVDVNDGMGTAQNGSTGEVQTVKNPLIQTAAAAANVAEWIRGILANRTTLSGEYRADPRLDALDKVTVQNKYATKTVFITSVKYSYNGAFRGSYEGRALA